MSDMSFDEVRRLFVEKRAGAAVDALRKRGFDARFFPTSEEAVNTVLGEIPVGSSVGAGGSVTLQEAGILDLLADRGDEVIYHRQGMGFPESLDVRKKAIACPYFLCSSNAITLDGELINTDGIGNRVCGMIFGPATVYVLAGINKLVRDREEGFSRIRNVAAPANAVRLGIDTPCVEKGRCVDCRSPLNICRVTTMIQMKPMFTDIKVFIIGEELGL